MKMWETIVLRIRMMPFKTKLTPNFQMDWGVNYPKATYPIHEKLPVKVFDLKGFVEKKREDKINNMLNNPTSSQGGGLPLGGFGGMPSGLSGLPGMSGMPGMPQGLGGMSANSFAGSTKPSNNSFNIDEMVKRIDAKIAELEEEEKKEQENNQETKSDKKSDKQSEGIVDADIEEVIKPETKIENSNNTNNNITDDQFFDDFFSD